MPNYLTPGVYIEEMSSGSKPISGAGTSTAAFVGIAEKGVIGRAVLITNWSQYVKEFGGFLADYYLAYAVYGFFAEGGTTCYVVRTCHYDGTGKKTAIASSALIPDKNYTEATKTYSFRVKASSEGTWGDKLLILLENATEGTGFQLTVYQNTVAEDNKLENFDQLTMDTVEDTINYSSKLIRIETSWTGGTSSNQAPKLSAPDGIPLTSGNNGLANLAANDLYGDEAAQTGLHAFDIIDGINIVAIPEVLDGKDTTYQTIISQGLMYCKNRKDCFFVADPPKSKAVTDIKTFKNFSSTYGALYYPWVYISDPLNGGQKKLVPPSGVVAGTYAYTDANRGVHKAPAGITDGYLDSVNGVETVVTKNEQELLNPIGINVIRSFPAGICIWGARTLSADPEWTYVNVRRLLIYIEKSLYKGTQWVVFEPNDPNLWGNVKRNITAFLTKVWRDGALFGSTPEEAFFVKVDAENNPQETRDLGQLIIDVGVAPVKPAEFVIIRISQKRAQ